MAVLLMAMLALFSRKAGVVSDDTANTLCVRRTAALVWEKSACCTALPSDGCRVPRTSNEDHVSRDVMDQSTGKR